MSAPAPSRLRRCSVCVLRVSKSFLFPFPARGAVHRARPQPVPRVGTAVAVARMLHSSKPQNVPFIARGAGRRARPLPVAHAGTATVYEIGFLSGCTFIWLSCSLRTELDDERAPCQSLAQVWIAVFAVSIAKMARDRPDASPLAGAPSGCAAVHQAAALCQVGHLSVCTVSNTF